MSTKRKLLLIGGIYILVVILLLVIFGTSGKNDEFKPQNEFKLDAWIPIKLGSIDLSINRAVLYLVLASGLTTVFLTYLYGRALGGRRGGLLAAVLLAASAPHVLMPPIWRNPRKR